MKKPQLFIGSSTEAKGIARAIRQNLSEVATVIPWFYAFQEPGSTVIHEILNKANEVDFAIFIFSPDDFSEVRGESFNTVRDNVILEFGIFLGILGLERCYIVKPKGVKTKLPSDLLGVNYLKYDIDDFKVNKQTGVSNATDVILDKIDSLSFFKTVNLLDEFKDNEKLKESFIRTPKKK